MKRILILAACLLIAVLSFTACGSKEEPTQAAGGSGGFFDESDESTSEQETMTLPAPAETTAPEEITPEETTEAPTEETPAEPAYKYMPGDDQTSAVMIPLNEKIEGEAKDGKIWYYAFQTKEAGRYTISAVNKTPGGPYLGAQLVNEDGGQIDYTYANGRGCAESFSVNLSSNTVYYLRLYSNDGNSYIHVNEKTVEFVFVVKTENDRAAYWGEGAAAAPNAKNQPGMNMDEPAMIPLDEKITGQAKDGRMWYYAFKTGNGLEYTVSVVNKTPESHFLGAQLVDENGSQVEYTYANAFGGATSYTQKLSPNTVYYLRLYSNDANSYIKENDQTVDFVLAVRDLSNKTVGALWGEGDAAVPDAAAQPGTNADEPAMIPVNEKITGQAKDGRIWYYAFKTGDAEEYTFAAVNKTLRSPYLGFQLVTESGRQVEYVYSNALGTVGSYTMEHLSPNTVYYLRLYSNDANSYISLSERTVDFVFAVYDRSHKTPALWGEGDAAVPDAAAQPGTNQDAPAAVPFDETVTGTSADGLFNYYSFRTEAAGEYTIRAINKTGGDTTLLLTLLDEFGHSIHMIFANERQSTAAMTAEFPEDTVYYLRVNSNDGSSYLSINEQIIEYELFVKGGAPDAGEPAEKPEEMEEEIPEEKPETKEDIPFGIGIMDGEEEASPIGYTVGDLIELGFETEEDVTVPIASREVCEVFTMTRDGIPFTVRAVDPYADEIPLNDCIVCYFGFTDRTGLVTVDGDIGCGSTVRDEVVARFTDPLVEKDEYVVYQTSNPEQDYDNEYGEFVISEDVQTCDVVFSFDGEGTLDEVIFLAPYLLYNTLAENLEDVDVGKVDPFALEEAEEARDDILERLMEAFDAEGIEVEIDEDTGRITLDEGILFDFNSYELSEKGRAYIDKFLRAFAGALLDGEHADSIQKVEIGGHTDTNGSYEYNQELSEKRAGAVLTYCTGENGAGLSEQQAETFASLATAVGYSYDYPKLDENGKVDADKSRRVEIQFFLSIEE